MGRYTTILWDLDQTLLDFDRSQAYALRYAFDKLGLSMADGTVALYAAINDKYWKRLERGEITKAQVLTGRFEELLKELSITTCQVQEIADIYQNALGSVAFYLEGAKELVTELKERGYRQYIVTNGVNKTQANKMKVSGLDQLVDGVFVSELMGYPKPRKEYFDHCLLEMPGVSRGQCILVGDSLTSDMQGANNAGIAACWYNPKGLTNELGVRIDYEIKHLWELWEVIA